MEKYYGDKEFGGSAPSNLGDVTVNKKNIFILKQTLKGTNGLGMEVKVEQYRFFIRVGDDYKLDWQASVCYNLISPKKFKALKDGSITTMRCVMRLSSSSYDDYFAFDIRDDVNFICTAYMRKDDEVALKLVNELDEDSYTTVILKLQYTNEVSSFSKKSMIASFVQYGWVVLD